MSIFVQRKEKKWNRDSDVNKNNCVTHSSFILIENIERSSHERSTTVRLLAVVVYKIEALAMIGERVPL